MVAKGVSTGIGVVHGLRRRLHHSGRLWRNRWIEKKTDVGRKPKGWALPAIPKWNGIKQQPCHYAHRFHGQVPGQDMAGLGLCGTLVGKTQMTKSDSKARGLKSPAVFTHVFGTCPVMTQKPGWARTTCGLSMWLGHCRSLVVGLKAVDFLNGSSGFHEQVFLVDKAKTGWPFFVSCFFLLIA